MNSLLGQIANAVDGLVADQDFDARLTRRGHELVVGFDGPQSPFDVVLTDAARTDPCYAQTRRFRLAYRTDAAGTNPEHLALVDRLAARLGEIEVDFDVTELARLLPPRRQVGLFEHELDYDSARSFGLVRDWYAHRHGHLASYLPQLVALRCGMRTAIQLGFADPQAMRDAYPRLEQYCCDHGLHISALSSDVHILISNRNLSHFVYHRIEDDWHVLSNLTAALVQSLESSSLEPLRDCYELIAPGGSEPRRHGRLYGYPSCCVAALGDNRGHPTHVDTIGRLLRDRTSVPRLMNPFLMTTPFQLSKHLPCSLDCEATLSDSRKLRRAIEATDPVLGRYIDRFTSLPVLFTDVCGTAIVLDGQLQPDGVSYREAFYPTHPSALLPLSWRSSQADCQRFDELFELLAQGSHVQLDKSQLVVSDGRHVLDTMPRPPHLAWRLVHFDATEVLSGR